MELAETSLFYGGITSALLSALILISLYVQPRIWMQDLPKEVRSAVPEKTRKEKKQSLVVLLLFLVLLIGLPALAVYNHKPEPPLMKAWLITYSSGILFNLTDLLIIDWLVVCTITPDFIRIKGIDERVYKNYRKHFYDFLKGIFLIALPSFISALLGWLCCKIQV